MKTKIFYAFQRNKKPPLLADILQKANIPHRWEWYQEGEYWKLYCADFLALRIEMMLSWAGEDE